MQLQRNGIHAAFTDDGAGVVLHATRRAPTSQNSSRCAAPLPKPCTAMRAFDLQARVVPLPGPR